MPDRQVIKQLSEELLKRKKDLLDSIQMTGEKWSELQKRVIEDEDWASRGKLAAPYDGLDESTLHQLGRVQKALRKIELQRYGICELCGQRIGTERLLAQPEAERCLNCAAQSVPMFGNGSES